MSTSGTAEPAFSVLFVCTGNICRSALAERLASAYLAEALGEEAGLIRVRSAGTQAVVGSGVHPDSARVLAGFGGEPAGFTARQLAGDMAAEADLTLALTRNHRREVLLRVPRALSRTFTLREAADLLALTDPCIDPVGDTFRDRGRALVAAMAAARPRRSGSGLDDIADPIGQPLETHQEVGDVIADSLLPLLDRLVALRLAGTSTQ